MKPLQDCEFTAFISYAHADDDAWFNWVTQFRTELERGLQAMLRGVRLPRLHLSGENGPVAGALSEELRRRVEASFAMIIVVHDNFAQSDWCLKELAYFKSLFGEQGLRERLYIVALSEAAMLQVSGSAAWRALMPGDDQIWMPFFDPADKARPLDIYMGPGLVSPAFRQPFERLRSNFAAKLRQAAALPSVPVSRPAPELAAAPAPGAAGAAPSTTTGGELLIGFVPPASAAAAVQAANVLAQRGLPARVLSQDVVFNDFADYARAERLLLAFDDAPLMMTSLAAGGHLEVQRDAWLKRGGTPERLHWLDLRTAAAAAAPPQGAAAWVAAQGGAMTTAQALADLLRPPAPAPAVLAQASGVRIYIESNRNERTLWEPLGEQIRRKWDDVCRRVAPGRVPALSLRPRGLPVDQIDSFPSLDDADGVVLLWGRKTSEALVAQINKVENKMTPGRDAAPGIVAYLMPPQQATEPVPAWGWQVLRFNAASEDDIDVVTEENDQLERFLKKVYERRHQRDVAGGTP
ncbi:MAG: TIR domain-containing protein [Rubrivivax sp.]|nr:TIR domain-containing protein [Rubrivivax sp.]